MVDQALLSDNAETMRRLEALVARLSDDDLRRDLGEGWTVAVALAHAGFWDQRAVYGLRRWAREGTPITDADDHILNEALFEQWRALPPRRAAELAVEAAREVTVVVEGLPDAVAADVVARGLDWLLRRSRHRREHSEQFEAALKSALG